MSAAAALGTSQVPISPHDNLRVSERRCHPAVCLITSRESAADVFEVRLRVRERCCHTSHPLHLLSLLPMLRRLIQQLVDLLRVRQRCSLRADGQALKAQPQVEARVPCKNRRPAVVQHYTLQANSHHIPFPHLRLTSTAMHTHSPFCQASFSLYHQFCILYMILPCSLHP